jgi:hypothetical protein
MNNIQLFEYSLENQNDILENIINKEDIVITSRANDKNELMLKNERLIDLITSYKTLKNRLTSKQEDEILSEVDSLLFNKEKMNYSAFSQYFMVWDLSHSLLREQEVKERKRVLKSLLNKYIQDRHSMYLEHGYSNMILQVISDNYSHKRKGMTGINKLEVMLKNAKIPKYDGSQNIANDIFYLLPDKEGKSGFMHIISHKKISLTWSKDKQGKMPDAYIQNKKKVFVVEHKYKKEEGGGQNSQIVELVDFIKNSDKNISYISYMDGVLFNDLATSVPHTDNKILKTKRDIYKHLGKNVENYFVNTAGFRVLLNSISNV